MTSVRSTNANIFFFFGYSTTDLKEELPQTLKIITIQPPFPDTENNFLFLYFSSNCKHFLKC